MRILEGLSANIITNGLQSIFNKEKRAKLLLGLSSKSNRIGLSKIYEKSSESYK